MRKQILSSALLCCMISGLLAQVPNAGLENWSNKTASFPPIFTFNYFDPDEWISANVILGADSSVYRVSGTDKYAGNYAAKIVTKKLNSAFSDPMGINDTSGLLITGKLQSTKLIQGFPYTQRPASLVFFSKYTPVGADSGGAVITLTKWNAGKRDTIGYGVKYKGASPSYGIHMVSITYKSGATPDTCNIYLTSSHHLGKPQVGSTLYADEFQLAVGINDKYSSEKQLYAFPNPATNQITFMLGHEIAARIIVYDITGKEVRIIPVESIKVKADISNLSPGVYIYKVLDGENNPVGVNKFSISR